MELTMPPEHVGPMRRAVPGTEEAHHGQGTSVPESREGKEVTDAG